MVCSVLMTVLPVSCSVFVVFTLVLLVFSDVVDLLGYLPSILPVLMGGAYCSALCCAQHSSVHVSILISRAHPCDDCRCCSDVGDC